jgi:nitrite reductase (NO-forming)
LLGGAVVLAISGASLMLTVTWSAAPAPADRWVRTQRLAVAVGIAGVGLGREAGAPDTLVGVAAVVYLGGLLLLGALLLTTVRRGVERRFDAAVAAYLTAITAGTCAALLGMAMALRSPTHELRSAHVTLNVLGLVGLVVGGTLPYFAATVGRTRMAAHVNARRLELILAWQTAALTASTIGISTATNALATAGLTAYAVGIVGVMAMSPRPTRRQWRWAGPRLFALWCGAAWWATAVAASAVDAAAGDPVIRDPWLLVLVVGGYAQIVWGSLAYLLPMLRGGGHERLGEGFATTRSWLGLGAANLAALSLATSLDDIATIAITIWVADTAWRVARLTADRAVRSSPSEERGSQ